MEWIISAASLVVAIIALYKSAKISSQQLASNQEMNELQKKQLELQKSVAAFQKAQYEEEHRTPDLSKEEQRILLMLAQGGQISFCRDEKGEIDYAMVFGCPGAEMVKPEEVLYVLPSMNTKQLLEQNSDKLFSISEKGHRIAQKLSE